jgi:hypothetical protein
MPEKGAAEEESRRERTALRTHEGGLAVEMSRE